MASRITWTHTALADLRDLVRYIARDNPQAARKFGDLIVSRVESLAAFPRIARMVPEYRMDRLRERPVRRSVPGSPAHPAPAKNHAAIASAVTAQVATAFC